MSYSSNDACIQNQEPNLNKLMYQKSLKNNSHIAFNEIDIFKYTEFC